MNDWPDLLPHLLGHPPGQREGDGFGQSLIADLRYLIRYRRLRRRAIAWRKPTAAETQAIADDPFLGRFADGVHAVAWTTDGLACVVLDRLWHGWPDPPQYALFAMRELEIEIAADFHTWPKTWALED